MPDVEVVKKDKQLNECIDQAFNHLLRYYNERLKEKSASSLSSPFSSMEWHQVMVRWISVDVCLTG